MRRLLALCAAMLLAPAAFADNTSEAFLKIGVGARPIAMGSAFTAVADDVSAVHWNPAGLTQLKQRELGAMDAQLFADTRLDFIGFAQPLKGGTLAFSSLYLSQSPIEARGENREQLGTFTASDMALSASYARPVGRGVSLGLTGKYLQSRIAEASAQGWAVDAGGLYDAGDGVTFGAGVQNLGPGMTFLSQASKLPLSASAGAAWRLPMGLLLAADYKREIYDQRDSFSMGTELTMMRMVALRAGYLSRLAGGGTANGQRIQDINGLGVGLGLRLSGFTFDYAFTPMGELGSAQRLSFGLKF